MKKKTIKQLKTKLWKLVSEYSRRKDCDGDYGNCVSCGKSIHWKYEGNAGHFIPKAQGEFYRWELKNIHLQCVSCNCNNPRISGNETAKVRYTLYMQERYGHEYVDYLLDKSDKERKYKRWDYEQMIEDIENKLRELECQK